MNDIAIVEMDDFKKQRIAVLCLPGLESFLGEIVAELEKTYAVRTCYSNLMPEIEKVVEWCDCLWIEWGNALAVELSQKMPILKDKQVLLRIHSYEVLSGFLPQIRWENITSVIFVADHIKSIAIKQIPNLPEMVDIHVVANGVAIENKA